MGSITTENPVSRDDQLSCTLDDLQDTPEEMDQDTNDNNQLDQTNTVQDETDLTPDNNQDNQTPDDPSDTQKSKAHKNQQDRSNGTISETSKQLDSDNSVSEKDTDQQEVIIFEKEVYIDTEDENQKDDDYQVKYGAVRAIRARV